MESDNQTVLYSHKDRSWKVADFGLTCEGTSTAHIFTDFSHGTPGYRAPELLKDDGASFTNKVDIWAMGCILFELATGAKPFVTDFAVSEYSRGGSEVETRCRANIKPDMVKKISDTVHDMFQIRPSLRPKSSALAKLFHEYYLLAKEHGGIQPCEATSTVNAATSSSTRDGTLQCGLIDGSRAGRLIR